MNGEDRRFDQVRAGSCTSYPCSPPIKADRAYLGIRLAAPAEVRFGRGDARDARTGAFARVIVCGAYRFPSDYLGLRERFLERMLLVAVDAASHRAFAGRMEGLPNAEPRRDGLAGVPAAELAQRRVVEYFNPNLASALDLPEQEADYLAYATLGEHVSNVVRIAVRRYDDHGAP